MNTFKDLNLSSELFTAIEKLGFTEPTQIQEKAIPHIIEGRDVVGESATGSGKTLAFGCGVIEHVIPKAGLQALILTPTRELAQQVKDSIKKLAMQKQLHITAIYGGVAINPQIAELKKCEIVVATPGRLLDHYQRRTIDLTKIKLLILDEADRMLDMGFIDDVEKIIKACPRQKQILFFSATISTRIDSLVKKHLHEPIEVRATKQVDPSKLKQVYYDISKNMKLSLLIHLLEEETAGLVIVFCNTRSTTDFVLKNLKANKIDATAIHGGLSQNKRTRTIKSFNDARVSVLVCTDVAARGLHIDNVSHVYNYEIPKDSKDYVHRIGRTARAGEAGKVINLLCDVDHGNFSRILSEYRSFKIENIPIPQLKRVQIVKVERNRSNFRGRPGQGRGHGSGSFPPRRGSHRRSY
jgi:ATP-dependent RNA helicase DeaD